MVGCFVPRCNSGHNTKKQYHSFTAPAAVAGEWVRIMKKLRSDTAFNPKNKDHRICSLHFEDKVIVKVDRHIIQGQIVELQRDRWSLCPDAIPTIFGELPAHLRPQTGKIRRAIQKNPIKCKKQKLDPESLNPTPLKNPTPVSLHDVIRNWWKDFSSQSSWQIDSKESNNRTVFHLFSYGIDHQPNYKSVIICSQAGNATVLGFMNMQKVFELAVTTEATIVSDVQNAFTYCETTFMCQGIQGFSYLNEHPAGKKENGTWYSKQCFKHGEFKVCENCKKFYHNLSNNITSKPKTTQISKKQMARKKSHLLRYYKQSTAQLKLDKKQFQTQLRNIKSSLRTAEPERIKSFLVQLDLPLPAKEAIVTSIVSAQRKSSRGYNLPLPAKEAIVTSIVSAQRKSSRGYKYSTCWLLECLLLNIKSPAAYKHLRESKILPLPHPKTLRNLIAGQKCEYGLNDAALRAIEREFKSKPQRDRQGVLIFDELQLRETLEYNPHTFRLDGYVDYGIENTDLNLAKDELQVANHALVLMYRPMNDSWVQPLCAFATRNAAKGPAIQKVVMQTIVKLESINAEVLAVVCDGSKPNKLFWKLCGVGEINGETINKIPHPCSSARFLYFTSDVPHLFKCIRNHILKYIFFNLLSGTVATALHFYREMGVESLAGSENTEEFTAEMNKLFDALNAWNAKDGVRIESDKLHILQSFYAKLCTIDLNGIRDKDLTSVTFASKETLIALKVTLKSTIEIIYYLTEQLGYHYVLTAKLNQDSLEKFFGLVRAAGGREDHPTVSNFIQLFRLLSLYTPVKRCLRGNIGTDTYERVLVDLEQEFRISAGKSKADFVARSKEIDNLFMDKLLEGATTIQSEYVRTSNNNLLQDYCEFDKNLVFYLAGFLCYRSKKLLSCNFCASAICSDKVNVSCEFDKLTKLLDYGGLSYPTSEFFNSVILWEASFNQVLKLYKNNGDIILECLNGISPSSIVNLGCGETSHCERLVRVLVPYYISMRIHFYTRSVRNEMGKGKATKTRRKQSKLAS